MRIALRVILVIVLVYAAFLCAAAIAMRQPPDTFGAIMARTPTIAFMVLPFERLWMSARAGQLHPGDPAPDFTLKTADLRSATQLSSFRGQRPVVLVFGSYT
jgi:hypothetical protein